MTSGALDDTRFPELGGSQEERVARRVAELFDSDAQFRVAVPVPEVIEAAQKSMPVGSRPSGVFPPIARLAPFCFTATWVAASSHRCTPTGRRPLISPRLPVHGRW